MANLLRIIQHMKLSKTTHESTSKVAAKQDELAQKFPALALPNENPKPTEEKELKDDDIVNSAMASLEELAPSNKKSGSNSKKEVPPSDGSDKKSKHSRRSRSKDRRRHRSRSRDRKRHKSRSRSRSRDRSKSRERRRHRSRDRRRSRSRDRSTKSRDHRDRHFNRHGSDRSRSRSVEELSMDPEVGKIYSGKVANIVPFGCFVQLEGLKRRWEGLVHISQLRKEGRVASASDVVSRGQKVLVKVLNIGGQKVEKDIERKYFTLKIHVHL